MPLLLQSSSVRSLPRPLLSNQREISRRLNEEKMAASEMLPMLFVIHIKVFMHDLKGANVALN